MADTLAWIDFNNVTHLFDGSSSANPLITDEGRANMYMPPVALVDQRTPLYPGTLIRYADVQPRSLVLPVVVNASGNESTLVQQLRAMSSYFNPFYSGIWQHTAPDGIVRQLFATYQEGMQGDESAQNRGPGWQKLALTFLAADPFWYDRTATVVTLPAGYTGSFLSNQFLPLNLTGTSLLNTVIINNTGDWETWPVIQVHGPGNQWTFANMTTGKSFALTANGGISLAANQVLTIDCSFGKKTILLQDGSSQAGFLVPGGTLFSLATGVNEIAIGAQFASTASVMQITYKQRYFAP